MFGKVRDFIYDMTRRIGRRGEGIFRHDYRGDSSKEKKPLKPRQDEAKKETHVGSEISATPKGESKRDVEETEINSENIAEKSAFVTNADDSQFVEDFKGRNIPEMSKIDDKPEKREQFKELEQNAENIIATAFASEPKPEMKDAGEPMAEDKKFTSTKPNEAIQLEKVRSDNSEILEDGVEIKEIESAEEPGKVLSEAVVIAIATPIIDLDRESRLIEKDASEEEDKDTKTFELRKFTDIIVEEGNGEKKIVKSELEKDMGLTESNEIEYADSADSKNDEPEIEKLGVTEKEVFVESDMMANEHYSSLEFSLASITEHESQSIEEKSSKVCKSFQEFESAGENMEADKNDEGLEVKNLEQSEKNEGKDEEDFEGPEKSGNDPKNEIVVITVNTPELQLEDGLILDTQIIKMMAAEANDGLEETLSIELIKVIEQEKCDVVGSSDHSDQTSVHRQELNRMAGMDQIKAVQRKEASEELEDNSDEVNFKASEQNLDFGDVEQTAKLVEPEEIKETSITDGVDLQETDKLSNVKSLETIKSESTACQSTYGEAEIQDHKSGVDQPIDATANASGVEKVQAEIATDRNKDVSEELITIAKAKSYLLEVFASEGNFKVNNAAASEEEENREVKKLTDESVQSKAEEEATLKIEKVSEKEILQEDQKALTEENSEEEELDSRVEEPEPTKMEEERNEIQQETENFNEERREIRRNEPEQKQVKSEGETEEEEEEEEEAEVKEEGEEEEGEICHDGSAGRRRRRKHHHGKHGGHKRKH